MEFESTPERTQLRRAVRRAVESYAPEQRIRDVMGSPSGFDPDLWKVLDADLGVTKLLAPGDDGATAAPFVDVAAVLEELGRGPVCAPYLGTAVLAPSVLTACDGAVAASALRQLGTEDLRATASLEHDFTDAGTLPVTARETDGSYRLDGEDPFVVDSPGADLLLVAARVDQDIAIFLVAGDADGLSCTTRETMDQTRRVGRLAFRATPAQRVAARGPARAALVRAQHIARVALACEQVGGAARCLELSVAYAKHRKQFGVPIGSFQSIKHKCADMLVSVELARSAAEYAAYCIDARPDDLAVAALLAGSLCSQSYLDVAAGTIQVHGGIGFTWDNYAHLYFKRAKSSALMYGQPVRQRAELGSLIGL